MTTQPLLGVGAPVPVDRPFTRDLARREGVTDRQLATWVACGLLVHPLRSVYYAAQLADGIDLRLCCLALVVPDDAVITDRTAGWLHGACMILAPGEHLVVPEVSVFRPPGYRLRNGLSVSGERSFSAEDVVELGGLRVTSILRTACDLGMRLPRDQGFAAMDALMRLAGFGVDRLVAQGPRFKGYRNVRRFRSLAPYVDGRSQSPGESILRLRWLDCPSLPPPVPQVPVQGPGGLYFLDLGVEGILYGAEYDGVRWHGPEQEVHDRTRRDWLRDRGEWVVDVFVDHHVFGPTRDVEARLHQGVAEARRRLGTRAWSGADRIVMPGPHQ